ncbi:putative phosphatase [Rubidibacter lacunae KORDI 51-2]|uniref:Putative phosphatase n=1 Tax=Rubidibacter lacunae KORDI 51-2 TaxID=582515 RepID=U5DLP9_9CHRO|nr:alkaline phosphatase PhoX [Rubidibacter lacunae]ERN40625.1 putative phosphatase [Rubidibacter lacunae KORDI 51-2]
MSLKRREFLLFLGAGASTYAIGSQFGVDRFGNAAAAESGTQLAAAAERIGFEPVKVPLPLEFEGLSAAEQMQAYSSFEVIDGPVIPDGYTADFIGAWGDVIGDSRFGYNNDFLSFVETGPDEGLLTINFEYISGGAWMQSYQRVLGKSLPFQEVIDIAALNDGEINAFALPDSNPLKQQIVAIAKEAFTDQGIGVVSVERNANGNWVRTNSKFDRRITGISGLDDGRYLRATGPSVAIFLKSDKLGYDDGLGNRIIGTFQNCAGGTTPWGTILSAEENFQDQVHEPVKADGSAFDPSETPFVMTAGSVDGRGNVFGLSGNKYGWMVEVDPANANDYGVKHTWLGRYRHEAVGVRAVAGKPLAVYSGCDRRGGHLYKFVSTDCVKDVTDKANSLLMEAGMLYGAKFEADGTGRWIALTPDTPVDPVLPSTVVPRNGTPLVKLPNRDRAAGGIENTTTDDEARSFARKFSTLGDLYIGNNRAEKQGAILIDAHYAASAAGVTCTARPEDTDVAADGTLYIAFTSGSPGGDGGPDQRIFQGPNGETPYEFGWIMKLQEDGNDPASVTFRWEMFALGGTPAEGGLGFSNPDNLEIDRNGNLWMVTDMSTSKHNSTQDPRGVFGNNSVWFIPTSGPEAGQAFPFAIGPMECEVCGPTLTRDSTTLFLAFQHPGERNGIRKDMAATTLEIKMQTTNGQDFVQARVVPTGSNWPGKQPNDPPRPGVIAVRRIDGNPLSSLT